MKNCDAPTLERVRMCIRGKKADEIALGNYLARTLISESESKALDEVMILHRSDGKPYVKNPDLHISISHSDGTCAAALSNAPVGCDIQSRRRFGGEAVKGFFTQEEYEYISKSEDSAEAMTRLWCIREAMIKLKGQHILKNRISFINKEAIESCYGVSLIITKIDQKSFVIARDADSLGDFDLIIKEVPPF